MGLCSSTHGLPERARAPVLAAEVMRVRVRRQLYLCWIRFSLRRAEILISTVKSTVCF